MGTFPAMLAIDGGGNAASNAEGQLYSPDDTNALSPLSPSDLNGFPFPGDKLIASSLGILPGFRIDGFTAVDWVSGAYRITIPCIDQIPKGGATGQYLVKTGPADYEVKWVSAVVEGDGGSAVTGGAVQFVRKVAGGTWAGRPTADAAVMVIWVGPDPSPPIVTTGTGGMRNGIDLRFITA